MNRKLLLWLHPTGSTCSGVVTVVFLIRKISVALYSKNETFVVGKTLPLWPGRSVLESNQCLVSTDMR